MNHADLKIFTYISVIYSLCVIMMMCSIIHSVLVSGAYYAVYSYLMPVMNMLVTHIPVAVYYMITDPHQTTLQLLPMHICQTFLKSRRCSPRHQHLSQKI